MTGSSGYEDCAHLYDLFDDKDNLDFFRKYAHPVQEVLDVGAGTGRIAMTLARAGTRLTCVEPSPAMRRQFRLKLASEPEVKGRIEIIEGSAEGFKAGKVFELAILSGCFDHFLNDCERLAALRNIAGHLKPAGRLVMDSFLGLMGESSLKPAGEVVRDGLVYKRLVGGSVVPGGMRDTRLVFETYSDSVLADRIEVHSLVGVTTREHIHEVLDEAGFRIEKEFGDYDFTPYSGQDVLIIDAVRV